MVRHAPYSGNISAKKLFHSNADSHVNVRIAMEILPEKISPIKGAALPKTYRFREKDFYKQCTLALAYKKTPLP